jgi:non-heme chloroperoxidase
VNANGNAPTVPDVVEIPSAGVRIVGDHWAGDGPPVILAHGGGQTRHSWGGTAAALAAGGHEVLSIDLRGHGDSEWAADKDYSMAAYASDARIAADWIGRPVCWVGASLGGMTGLHAVHDQPEQFRSLVLVDITTSPAKAGVSRILEFMGANSEHGFGSLEEAADAIAAYQPHRPRPRDLSGLAKNLRMGDDGRYRWHWDPAFLVDRTGHDSEHARDESHRQLSEKARRLELPTLLIRGRLSDLVTAAEVEEFMRLVPHAEHVDIAEAGHMIAGDKNDIFTEAVVRFLDAAD